LLGFFQFSDDVATRQVEVRPCRDAFVRDLNAGGRHECGFELLEISNAGLRRRIHAEQRSKCSTVYRTRCGMIPDSENQGRDIDAPASFLLQVETARSRPNGLMRRTISQQDAPPKLGEI
jgi:hypothetical protein